MTGPDDRDDRELDALLRQPGERLSPPEGSWERVSKRARRRKALKAVLSVAAGVVVLGGALPAVIAVRDNSNNQKIVDSGRPTATPHTSGARSASPAPSAAVNLAGFRPVSLSFIEQNEGYLWGSLGTSHAGSLVHTVDGGATWSEVNAPPVENAIVSGHGDGQVRFFGPYGFVYGSKYFVTANGAQTWNQLASPGYIDDLETMGGEIYALVRPCRSCQSIALYQATLTDPALKRVRGVPMMRATPGNPGVAGSASIAIQKVAPPDIEVDVLAGDSLWSTTNGRKWTQGAHPCPAGIASARLAAWNALHLVAVCGESPSGGAQIKSAYTSRDAGANWTQTAQAPSKHGYIQTLGAGSRSSFILGTSQAGAQITRNGGRTWHSDLAKGLDLSFVGFIDPSHIVGIADPAEATQGAYATSNDSGRSWQVTGFAG